MESAFKAYLYVLYTALSIAARLHDMNEDDDVFINAQGGISQRKVD